MKTITYLVLGYVLLFLTSCGITNSEYDASGTFEATEVIVSAEANGKILEFNISEGDILKANQEIGYIDTIQLYLKKLQIKSGMNTVESRRPDIKVQIAATQQQIETAKTEKKRIENLLKANAATQKQLDDINAQIAVLEKQLEAQKSTLESTTRSIGSESSGFEIQLAQIDDQLQKSHIKSPIDGTVLVKYSENGELAMQGKALFKVADTQNMLLRAYVTSAQLTQLKIGQKVKVFSDFGEDDKREYEGIITWISSKSEFTPKTIQTQDERSNLVYAVKIAVKNDGFLKIGMYGSIKIQ